METEFAFNDGKRSPWTHIAADGHSSVALDSEGLSRRSWEEFMAFDSQTQSPMSLNSHATTPSTTHGLTTYLAQDSKPEVSLPFETSSTSVPFSLAPANIPTLPMAFGQGTVNQGFPFSSPGLPGQTSPFSDYSRQDGVEGWDRKPMIATIETPRGSGRAPGDFSPIHSKVTVPRQFDQNSPSSAAESVKSHTSGSLPFPDSTANQKKRKTSSDDDDSGERSDNEKPGAKKTAHNMIEKRYRNNLNDKIAALRDAVPSLRVMCRNTSEGDEDDQEDLEGLAPAHKLNKATVLSKATEYIRHLQKQKSRQEHEIAELKAQVESYERMVKMGSFAYQPPVPTTYGDDMFARSTAVATSAQASQGMIPIPEHMARMRSSHIAGPPYTTAPSNYPTFATDSPNGLMERRRTTGPRGGNMARIMVGGFTTLMLMDGFWEGQHADGEVQDRGLFSIPITLFGRLLSSSGYNSSTGLSGLRFLGVIRVVLLMVSLGYLLAPIFYLKSHPQRKAANLVLRTKYSLASPVELRRKAWLTAIQTVWVPRHNVLLEAAALGLKTIKLSLRKLIGWDGYALLTGFTKDQEIARIRAWTIALDAQLTGGDAEISMSRLILTVLASGTLPSTPARLMLNALHIKILFWEAANAGYGAWLMLDGLSSKLAGSYWNAARIEYHAKHHSDNIAGDDCSLPEHLAALLDIDSDDVLVDDIIRRAYNLAWNKKNVEPTEHDEAMDAVIEDVHIASPLDALAAWWSTLVLNRILANSLELRNEDDEDIIDDLDLVVKTSPPPSSARIRALVAKAVLLKHEREQHIQIAMEGLPCPANLNVKSQSSSPLLDPVNLVADDPVPSDFLVALTLAKCLALVDSSSYQSHLLVTSSVNRAFPLNHSYTLLSFTSYILLVERLVSSPDLLNDTRISLERLATTLRIWIGSRVALNCGIPNEVRTVATDRCLAASKVIMGVTDDEPDIDLGYASQSSDAEHLVSKELAIPSITITSADHANSKMSQKA